MNRLYTIGHSDHTSEHFVGLLQKHGISAVADVRSSPYSRFAPQFNKEALQESLNDVNIEYVFLGRELGARRAEGSCYVDEQAMYSRIRELPIFRDGLKRVLQGMETYTVALTCSEADPLTCHRTVLICRELRRIRPGLDVAHVLGDGSTETHSEVEQRLVKMHKMAPELFGDLNTLSGMIEKAYDKQAERIAYRKVPAEA